MDTKQKALRFFEGLNSRDVDAAIADFADQATYLGIEEREGRLRRKEQVGKQAIHDYLTAFVRMSEGGLLHYEVVNIVAEGSVVMAEWTDVARNADGREYRNHGVNTWEFDGEGRVIRAKSFPNWDSLTNFDYVGRLS
jgi:ketosteroid isomerase-like protein